MGSLVMPLDPAIEQDFTQELKRDPIVMQFYEKGDYRDRPSIYKGLAHAQHRLGSVLPLPNGEAKPEDWDKWAEESNGKLKDKGYVVTKPDNLRPTAPDKYEIKRPENLPEGAWNEGLEQKAHQWAKKHGLSQDALSDAMGLYMEAFNGFGQAVQVDRQAQAAKVKEWADKEGIPLEQVDAAL